jgi:hypothetical protein
MKWPNRIAQGFSPKLVGRGSRKTEGYNRVEDHSTLEHDIGSKNAPSRWSIMSLGRGGGISGDRLGTTTGLLFLDGGETR